MKMMRRQYRAEFEAKVVMKAFRSNLQLVVSVALKVCSYLKSVIWLFSFVFKFTQIFN